MTTKPLTRTSLAKNLKTLGVEPEDILFIHSSFKMLGPVPGGAITVIKALEDAVGSKGLILMPSFNLVKGREKRTKTWDIKNTPSTVGWITEFFRRMPDTYRSDHYSHSVAARGKGAQDFVSNHLCQEGYISPWDKKPWGRTFGSHSPMAKAYQADGKILMLGVDYNSSTYLHFVEVILWNQQLNQNPNSIPPKINRPVMGEFWDQIGSLSRGLVGNAECRLFRIRPYIHTLLKEMENNSDPYVN